MEMKTLIQKIYLPHVHWSIIYNSQDMIGEWIKKMGCVCVRVYVCVWWNITQPGKRKQPYHLCQHGGPKEYHAK